MSTNPKPPGNYIRLLFHNVAAAALQQRSHHNSIHTDRVPETGSAHIGRLSQARYVYQVATGWLMQSSYYSTTTRARTHQTDHLSLKLSLLYALYLYINKVGRNGYKSQLPP
jgi:hypothetical protein